MLEFGPPARANPLPPLSGATEVVSARVEAPVALARERMQQRGSFGPGYRSDTIAGVCLQPAGSLLLASSATGAVIGQVVVAAVDLE